MTISEIEEKFVSNIDAYLEEHKGMFPSSREYRRRGYKPDIKTIKKITGLTFNELLKKTYDYDGNKHNYDVKEIKTIVEIKVVKHLKQTGGELITSREWDRRKYRPTRGTIRNICNLTFNELLLELGFEPQNIRSDADFSQKDIIESFKKFFFSEGRTPTALDLNKCRLEYMPSLYMLYKNYSSIEEAIIEAGLPLNTRGYSSEYLLQRLEEFIEIFDRVPYKEDFCGEERFKDFPEYRSYGRFGGVKRAVMLLDLSEEKKRQLLGFYMYEQLSKEFM